ncbi:4-deoxy-L-threo-5-hexosulose-uronate ketol-isomerase [Pontibacter ummariensis]|uniref:4-deoxy-L-threo-5-hexosulose-uronate ketol-isomerase n=1 Tax=Pontibacter ummariensis TaxID=1610492 RepID=A0A239H2I3_9BACT|nr:5-dehydro-4-deoxy-D-glucuronate isomerase [Pontibacter ummariensis]PRY10922.1 4-deoxy-L-threo-5-hexosulose-uronate ketol-isomerase [Pontibacter ummariensis]SNS75345.1 4-deoxy-L-threo-5-hexosulose-uronate ketol-isomerase [Pontibacter ummariensis]
MSITYFTRHAIHPNDSKNYDTAKLREAYLIEDLFQQDTVQAVYTLYDRLIVGGAHPVAQAVKLETFPTLRSEHFLDRRELGIINVGPDSKVTVDGEEIALANKEALYVGMGTKEVIFHPASSGGAYFYFNSAPAHRANPTKKVSLDQAETVELGSLESSNHRIIRKLLVSSVVETCQLQMGLTELQKGSVWNTMPAHTHDRRMEAYFYFNLPEDQTVCHFMGEPQETRHLFVKNRQAVISPPWSIHSGAGTYNYSFIWGMAGENLDYNDMDKVQPTELK